MSTRSYVGIIENGQVRYGYHHCDSHLESLGVDLFKCIKTKTDAYEQINEFAEMDMGDTISKRSFFAVPEHDIFIEFCYGFDVSDCQWYVSSCHFTDASKMYKLTDIVKDNEEMKHYADMYTEQYRDDIIKEIRDGIKADGKIGNDVKICLKLVTFNGDQEQFLINTADNERAVKLAIEANKKIGTFDNPEWDMEVEDKSLYTVESVDFNMLYEIIKRNDWLFNDNNVMAFRN